MRYIFFIWAVVEVLQLLLIGMLVVGYRNLQKRMDAGYRFASHPPRSVTDE